MGTKSESKPPWDGVKDKNIMIRVTAAEKEYIEAAALRKGITVASYLLGLARREEGLVEA